MSVVNINTATKEELISIRDIGDKRAQAIINARRAGPLTAETIKEIAGIPPTLWDPLIAAGRITFELPETTGQEDDIKKLLEKIKTENVILKQAEVAKSQELKKLQNDFDTHVKQLNAEMTTLTKQNELLRSEINNRDEYIQENRKQLELGEANKDKMLKAELQKQQQHYDEEMAKLKETFVQMKTEREELMHKVDEQTVTIASANQQNRTNNKKIQDLESRIKNLMEKVEEQARTIDKTSEKDRVLNNERQEQEERVRVLEAEIQHLRTSKTIESLAPRSVYSSESETRRTSSPSSFRRTASAQPEEPRRGNNLSLSQFPKLSTYDGTDDWKSYQLQFVHTARRFEWNEQQKLDNLLLCLRGKALKFFSTRPVSVQGNFEDLMVKMTQRFGNRDLPNSIRRQLQDARQTIDESIEEFAERVQEMATDGYVDATEDIVEMMATDAFLKGCQDKQAALLAMDKEPNRIDQALQLVKSAMHNRRVLLGHKRPEVRKVQFQDEVDSDSDSESTVRVLNKKTDKMSSWRQNLENRLEKTEKDISSIRGDISKILSAVSDRQSSRNRSYSPNRSRSPSPNRSPTRGQVICYSCNEPGHYSTNCPKKRSLASPPPKQLNIQGSGK